MLRREIRLLDDIEFCPPHDTPPSHHTRYASTYVTPFPRPRPSRPTEFEIPKAQWKTQIELESTGGLEGARVPEFASRVFDMFVPAIILALVSSRVCPQPHCNCLADASTFVVTHAGQHLIWKTIAIYAIVALCASAIQKIRSQPAKVPCQPL